MIAINPIAMPPSGDAASRASRDPRVEAELARFAALDLDGLRKRWRKVVGRPAPDHLTRPLLHRMLAYASRPPPSATSIARRRGSSTASLEA